MYFHAYRKRWQNAAMIVNLRRVECIAKVGKDLSEPKVALCRLQHVCFSGINVTETHFLLGFAFRQGHWHAFASITYQALDRTTGGETTVQVHIPIVRATLDAFLEECEMKEEIGDPSQGHGLTVGILVKAMKYAFKQPWRVDKNGRVLLGLVDSS